MPRRLIKPLFLSVTVALTTPVLAAPQHDVHTAEASKGLFAATVGHIGIGQPWSRALPPTAHTGALFVSIHNQGPADRLLSASVDIAETTELHAHIHQDGLMKMVQVDDIEVPANGNLELEPGGYHIMLIGLKQPLREGEHFPVRLEFAQAGTVELTAQVLDMAAGTAADEHSHH